jgi:hypothetical protein
VFIDLDRTLGLYDEGEQRWIAYNGALEALIELRKSAELILFTANTDTYVTRFKEQFPEIAKQFSVAITSNDFAPHFVRVVAEMEKRIALGQLKPGEKFLDFVYELWKENPALVMPEHAVSNADPNLTEPEWYLHVYLPVIAPNKAPVVTRYDGYLIDDEFVRSDVNPEYAALIAGGRAIFAGHRGGSDSNSGPNWSLILEKTQHALSQRK